ncbi:MAG: amidohydrolase family protein, partial [Acidimicrobiales bacterium]
MALHLGTSDPSGFFAGRSLAAHGVWLSEPDMAILADQDVAVAHCPQSNAKLASGVARPADMLAAGIRVGLGTDGPASNNDLDLWGLVGRLMHLAGQTNLASQCAARTLSSTIDPGGPDPIPCRCTPILT